MKRLNSWLLRLCLLACLLVPTIAFGQVVGSLSPARAGQGALTSDPQLQGAILTRLPNATFASADTLTPAFLETIDVLVLGVYFDLGGNQVILSTEESYALRDFALRGKGVVIFGDNVVYNPANVPMLGVFDSSITSQWGELTVPLAADNPVTGGPVPAEQIDIAYSSSITVPNGANPIATYPNGTAVGVYFDAGAIFPGSGPVVLFGDALPGFPTPENLKVFANSVAYVARPPLPPVPNTIRVGGWDSYRGLAAAVVANPFHQALIRGAFPGREVEFVPFNLLSEELLPKLDVILLSSVANGNTGVPVAPLSASEQLVLQTARAQGKGILLAGDNGSYVPSSQSFLNPLGIFTSTDWPLLFNSPITEPGRDPLSFDVLTGAFTSSWSGGFTTSFGSYPTDTVVVSLLPHNLPGILYLPGSASLAPVAAFADIEIFGTNIPLFQNTLRALAPQTRDITPPSTTLSFTYSGTDRTVSLAATDVGTAVYATYYQLNGGPVQTYAGSFTLPSDSTFTVTYWSVDLARNIETPANSYLFSTATGTTLTVTAPSGIVGQRLRVTADLRTLSGTGIAGQPVQLLLDGAPVRDLTTNSAGRVAFTLTLPEPAGEHVLTATFAGNVLYLPATGSATFLVSPDDVVVTPTAISGPYQRSVRLTARLTRATAGSAIAGRPLQFFVNGEAVGGPVLTNTSGTAAVDYDLAILGTSPLTVTFAGDATYRPGSGSSTVTVSQSPTRLTVTNVANLPGRNVTLTARLRRTSDNAILPGEQVVLSLNGQALGTFTSDDQGYVRLVYTIPAGTPAGTQTISASFAGSTFYLPSTGTGTLTVR